MHKHLTKIVCFTKFWWQKFIYFEKPVVFLWIISVPPKLCKLSVKEVHYIFYVPYMPYIIVHIDHIIYLCTLCLWNNYCPGPVFYFVILSHFMYIHIVLWHCNQFIDFKIYRHTPRMLVFTRPSCMLTHSRWKLYSF